MKFLPILAVLALALYLNSAPAPKEQPGPMPNGGFLLNSGWRVAPAGRQVPLGNLPMSSALSPDGQYLLVLNGGYMPPSISVLNASTFEEVGRTQLKDAWLGLTFASDGHTVYVGGGSQACVYQLNLSSSGKLDLIKPLEIAKNGALKSTDFIGDVAVSPDGKLVYAAALYRDSIVVLDPASGRIVNEFKTGRRPYKVLLHPDGKSFFVTNWADGTMTHHLALDGQKLDTVRLGAHPTAMLWRARKAEENGEEQARWIARIFVTAANTNTVYAVGVSESKELKPLESINVAMTPRHPLGMTPSALAMSAAGDRLYVVCSDANAVAVADISEAATQVVGFVPVGWYPTAVQSMPDGHLVVLNGKGARSFANPKGPNPSKRTAPVHEGHSDVEYVAKIQTGSASIIDPIGSEQLSAFTRECKANSPYRDELMDGVDTGASNPVPSRPGDPSPIEHVIYIVKENRTYDQVLGDVQAGNGDPSLTLFGQKITPNHHKLAREFVLFDNFYVNADVSADGHNWSAAAIASDYVQKLWPNTYGARRRTYDYEGGEPAALPPAAYLWNSASYAKVSMRNYGWWCQNGPRAEAGAAQVLSVRDPILNGVTNRKYRGFDLDYPDVERIRIFQTDLAEFEASGKMPSLMFLRLGNDHTAGAAPGKLSPFSLVADNDLALGMLVESVSKSKFWPKTAIFVLEDDAQAGPDHVDSHRSPAFILSPYTRRGMVDSRMYNTTSILRTIELILGLRPMTHFDAGARPMSAAFATTPNLQPYVAEKAQQPLDEKNPPGTPLAARSANMDFSEADRADDDRLNDVLWRMIRKTEPPSPVRSAFSLSPR